MPLEMKPDMQTSVQAAISDHLLRSVPLENAHARMVRHMLAQLLRHWRYEVPGDQGDPLDEVAYSVVAWQIQERRALGVGQRRVDDYVPQVLDAIKTGDWDSLAALPDEVWDWVRELTGLTRDEWRDVPARAAELLDTQVECPRCKSCRTLRESAAVGQHREPLTLAGRGSVRFICSRCLAGIMIDRSESADHAHVSRLPRTNRNFLRTAAFVALALVLIYLAIRHFM